MTETENAPGTASEPGLQPAAFNRWKAFVTSSPKAMWVFAVLSLITCFGFIFYTGSVWEDYFITYRHSENLAHGKGLVFQPGERVHGFTSPINTLLPALPAVFVAEGAYEIPLWFYRICSIIALLVGGGYLIHYLARKELMSQGGLLTLAALLALECKTIAYATNGQEAGFLALFILPCLALVEGGIRKYWKWAGICWAGLLYTRPDGCIYIAILGLIALILTEKGQRKAEFIGLIRAGLVCAVLYLPWFIFAFAYYGNPIPHTILAKMGYSNEVGSLLGQWHKSLGELVNYTGFSLLPIYASQGGWPDWLVFCAEVLGLSAAFYWAAPFASRMARIASLYFLMGCLYLTVQAVTFPWYYPAFASSAMVVLACIPFELARHLKQSPSSGLAPVLALGMAALFLFQFILQAHVVREQQVKVEHGIRIPVGKWLAAHTNPGDRVFLECLGYIGYFSRCHMLDYPGLASPSVSALVKERGPSFLPPIKVLKPEWLVLRPAELQAAMRDPEIVGDYEPTIRFISKEVVLNKDALGYPYLVFDAAFVILKRKDVIMRTEVEGGAVFGGGDG